MTPMLRHYLELKTQYPDAILFYRDYLRLRRNSPGVSRAPRTPCSSSP